MSMQEMNKQRSALCARALAQTKKNEQRENAELAIIILVGLIIVILGVIV